MVSMHSKEAQRAGQTLIIPPRKVSLRKGKPLPTTRPIRKKTEMTTPTYSQKFNRLQLLLCKARHPSCSPLQRLEIRTEVQRLQNELYGSKKAV